MRFLFVDRITASEPRNFVEGIKHITWDDLYLCPDDKGNYYFAPSFVGESLGQLAAWNVMQAYGFKLRPVAGVVASAKLHRHAYVGDTLRLKSTIEHLDESAVQYSSQAYIGDTLAFEVNGALGPMLPMYQFINEDEVRQQFHEIYRPTDTPLAIKHPLTGLSSITAVSPVHLQFDAVLDGVPGQSMHAVKLVSRMAPYFPDHFPLKPVLPMTVLLECQLNLAKQFMAHFEGGHDFQVTELRRIKMSDFIQPGDVVDCYLSLKSKTETHAVLTFRCEMAGKRVCVMELELQKTF